MILPAGRLHLSFRSFNFRCRHFPPSHFHCSYCSVLSSQIYIRVFNRGLRFLCLLTCSFLIQVKCHCSLIPASKPDIDCPFVVFVNVVDFVRLHSVSANAVTSHLNHVPVSASNLTSLFFCPDIHQNQGGDAKKKTI